MFTFAVHHNPRPTNVGENALRLGKGLEGFRVSGRTRWYTQLFQPLSETQDERLTYRR